MDSKGYTVRMDRPHFVSALIMLGFKKFSSFSWRHKESGVFVDLYKVPFKIIVASKRVNAEFDNYEKAYNRVEELLDERDSKHLGL